MLLDDEKIKTWKDKVAHNLASVYVPVIEGEELLAEADLRDKYGSKPEADGESKGSIPRKQKRFATRRQANPLAVGSVVNLIALRI